MADPYLPVNTESFPPTPGSGRSSRASSPGGVQMAPLPSAMSNSNFDKKRKELRWTGSVHKGPELPAASLDNGSDIALEGSFLHQTHSHLQVPPNAHSRYGSPSRAGETSIDYDSEMRPNHSFMTRKATGMSSNIDEEHSPNSSHRKGRALRSAYDRARQLASRVHRPSFSRRRSSSTDVASIPSSEIEKAEELVEDTTPRYRSGTSEAHEIVRRMSRYGGDPMLDTAHHQLRFGQVAPEAERDSENSEPRGPYHSGILFNLLRLYHDTDQETREDSRRSSGSLLPVSRQTSQQSSGTGTPRNKQKWYEKAKNLSSSSLSTLIGDSSQSSPGHGLKRIRSRDMLASTAKKLLPRQPRLEDEIRITVHIAEFISRQRYLMQLCQALMRYGAPTHRLEEYMRMTARVLEVDVEPLYLPGCMFLSFSDATTHTTELKLLRYPQAVDLGRLADVHEVYKEVVHDLIGVEEATQRLDEIIHRRDKFNKWWLILLYGCASACVGPFAFNAGATDMPMAFLLGCFLGLLKFLVVPHSPLYSNLFEVSASLVTTFVARALGSLRDSAGDPGRWFCFSSLAQSAIALILPGYIVLCGSLELQSQQLLAGSVRLVYAIIYSLALGFGMMLGTSFYGAIDPYASSASSCADNRTRFFFSQKPVPAYALKFPSVTLFTLCLIMIHQAKWKHAPMMLVISVAGYAVNVFTAQRFAGNTQLASAAGAFVIGVLGNLYSRVGHGLAAAAIMPAIFVQVPSGLAASGSLVAGLAMANDIKNHSDGQNQGPGGTTRAMEANGMYGEMVFQLASGMILVSVAIAVGLFLAALVVYPLGKRRSGLFSF